VLEQIQRLVGERRYRFTLHAQDEFNALPIELSDFEHAVRTAIVDKRTRDSSGESDYVYVLLGRTRAGHPLYCAGKLVEEDDGPRFKVITVH